MRAWRPLAGITVTGLCVAYLVWKVDFGKAAHVLAHAAVLDVLFAYAILVLALVPLAWRWQLLLRVRGVTDSLAWLLRAYFVSYALGQVLPTSLGGDATRIYETSRRHPAARGVAAGSVVLERVLGGCATLALAALGFGLALGRYSVGAYLWLELAAAVGAVILAVLLFARRARPLLRLGQPLLRRLRLERPLRAVYEGIHGYRDHGLLLLAMFGLTVAVQALRVLTIYLAGRAAGVSLSPLPYFVMGPLLFLVMLVPFTVNGFAIRESFFVSFLTQLGVSADRALATGFLYFLLSIALAVPGTILLGHENIRVLARRLPRRGS